MTLVTLDDGTAAARGYALLQPLARRDKSDGFYTLTLISALVRGDEEVWALAEYPGAAAYLAPDVAPPEWLPLLANATGARPLPSMTDAQRRAEISSPFDRRRGTNDAIIEETKRHLSGPSPYASLIERSDPGSPAADAPDDLTIITRTSETPADTTALELAWERVVPVDLTIHHVITDEPIINQGSKIIDNVTTATIDDATLTDIT
jgi:hypothetical protein